MDDIRTALRRIVTGDDEDGRSVTRVRPGQVVIQRSTNHAWEAIKGPALLLAVLIDRELQM